MADKGAIPLDRYDYANTAELLLKAGLGSPALGGVNGEIGKIKTLPPGAERQALGSRLRKQLGGLISNPEVAQLLDAIRQWAELGEVAGPVQGAAGAGAPIQQAVHETKVKGKEMTNTKNLLQAQERSLTGTEPPADGSRAKTETPVRAENAPGTPQPKARDVEGEPEATPSTNASVEEHHLGTTTRPLEAEMDPRSFALNQDFAAMTSVKKRVVAVPMRKPGQQTWFCPNPDPKWRIPVAVVELKEDREHFVVDPSLYDELIGEWAPKMLVACCTRQGSFTFWPIRLPDPDGRIDSWNESALSISEEYAGRWIRLRANRELGAYDVFEAVSDFPPPEWPDTPEELLRIAFKGRVIDTPDHRVIKLLRGEA